MCVSVCACTRVCVHGLVYPGAQRYFKTKLTFGFDMPLSSYCYMQCFVDQTVTGLLNMSWFIAILVKYTARCPTCKQLLCTSS